MIRQLEFTHQQLFNAMSKAAGEEVWDWLHDAELNWIFEDRTAVYEGLSIEDLPNLTRTQKQCIIEALTGVPFGVKAAPTSAHVLPVPWITQFTPQAERTGNGGQAVIAMLLRYHQTGGGTRTVDDLCKTKEGRMNTNDLRFMAAQHGLVLRPHRVERAAYSMNEVADTLDVNRPTALLVDYARLNLIPHLEGGNDQGWQWVLVVGYKDQDANVFFIHDPLWMAHQRSGRGGEYLEVTRETLISAVVELPEENALR